MNGWKTTAAGILTALGTALQQGGDGWIDTLGALLSMIGVALLGWAAKS